MELMDIIVEFINASLNLYITFFLFSDFWKRKYNAPITILSFFIIDILFTLSLLFFKGNIVIYLLIFLWTMSLSFLFESKLLHKIIYSAIMLAVMGVTEMIVAFLLSVMFSVPLEAIKHGILYITGMLISKFVEFLIVLSIRLKKHSPLLRHLKKNIWGILLFPLSTLIVVTLQHEILLQSPDQDIFTAYAVLISYTLLILANIIVFDFIDSLYKNTINESRIVAANEMISSQTVQYQELIDHNKEIMKIQHDNKNFYIGLISELKEGKTDDVIAQLTEKYRIYNTELQNNGNIVFALVNSKKQSVEEKNIEISAEYYGLQKISILPTDLAILLGNALDNAIEACECIQDSNLKTIDLSITLKNDNIVIIIKNPTSENIPTTDLSTNKKDSRLHGYGIISMKQIAAKYNGEVFFSCEDKIFTISIILNNSTVKHNE